MWAHIEGGQKVNCRVRDAAVTMPDDMLDGGMDLC